MEPGPQGVTPPRISWEAEHAAWREADRQMKARHSEGYYKMFRRQLLPPQLTGRAERMLKRIVSTAITASRQVPGGTGLAPGTDSVRWTRRQVREAVRALRRYIVASGGIPGEYRVYVKAFLLGQMSDLGFINAMTWALRLLEGAAFGPVERRKDDPLYHV